MPFFIAINDFLINLILEIYQMIASVSRRSVMGLYSDPRDIYSHRVRVVLAEKGVTVNIEDIDPDNVSDDLLELNPYGNTPTLVDRELVLYESKLIMEYLDERYPHPPLLAVDPVSRATTRLHAYRIEKDWYTKANIISSESKGIVKARKELTESLISSTPIFDVKPFFMSDTFTLADAYLGPLLWRLPSLGVKLPASTKPLLNYAERLFQREAFIESLTEDEKEMRL